MATLRQNVTADVLDFLAGRVIFSDGLTRLQYYQQFEELYMKEEDLSTFERGKLYNLSEITEFLGILTQGARPKDKGSYSIESFSGKNYIPATVPFCDWGADDWKCYRGTLVQIQTNLLRCDAKASIDVICSGEEASNEIDSNRSQDPWFTEKLFKVLQFFKLHEKLAPFRQALGNWHYDDHRMEMPLTLPGYLRRDFMDLINDEAEKKIRTALLSFLEEDQTTFLSPSAIRRLLEDPSQPFSYTLLLNRLNKLLRTWVTRVFDSPVTPSIILSNSEDDGKDELDQSRALKKLQSSRARLNDSVEDPLSEIVAAAAFASGKRKRSYRINDREAAKEDTNESEFTFKDDADTMKNKHHVDVPGARGGMLDKKKSATRLTFTPEEKIDDIEGRVLILPPMSQRFSNAVESSPAKQKRSQVKKYTGRRIWTDTEKNAIIEGIRRFGIGQWARVKDTFFMDLNMRTSGQIRDCFRTMKDRGELDGIDEAWPERKKAAPAKEEKSVSTTERNDDEQEEELNENREA